MFSVIVPTYNRAHLIRRTLESLLAQTDSDFEILVVDDGSTDDTESVVRGCATPRVQYMRKANAERGAARNFGAARSRGAYLNFFDSDDLAYPYHLSEARTLISERSHPKVFHLRYDVRSLDGALKHITPPLAEPASGRIPWQSLVTGNAMSCNGVFLHRDVALAHPFEEDRALAGTEDWVLWLRLAARFPIFENAVPTSSVVQHDFRSVNLATLRSLEERIRLTRHFVEGDPVCVAKFGSRALDRVAGHMHSYTALHAALGGGSTAGVLSHLLQAACCSPRELLHRRTLATFKHLVLRAVGGAPSEGA